MFEFQKNKKLVIAEIEKFLSSPLCNTNGERSDSIIIEAAKKTLDARKKEVERWGRDQDYQSIAARLIYHIAFDSLCSGQFHIYRGQIDPTGPGMHLFTVCEAYLFWCKSKGFLTADQAYDQIEYLQEQINEVG